jgi:hypothetical protein
MFNRNTSTMRNPHILISIILVFFVLTTHAQQFDFKKGKFTAPEYFIELPYESINNKIIVALEIKGKKRRFLVDTGAPLAISQQLFEELNPAVITKQVIRDINQNTDSLVFVTMDSLNIGNIIAVGVPAVVLKNNPIMDCLKVDGFLGSNVLLNSVIQFDSQIN